MPISGYFDTVFASSGSTVAVPDAAQPDGSVSYEQGYTVNYTLNPATNPSALNVEQTKFNQLLKDVTSAIQYFQQGNAAAFITTTMNGGTPYSYPAQAVVQVAGVHYISLVGSNTDTPPSANWAVVTNGGGGSQNVFTGGTTTGSANAQVIATTSPTSASFSNGQTVVCTAGFTNTGGTTFNAGGEGAITVKKDSGSGLVALTGGEIHSGDSLFFTKNTAGSCWVLAAGLALGTAAYLNTGTSANNVVQLDGSAKLPAVDGSQLTNIPSAFHNIYTNSGSPNALVGLANTDSVTHGLGGVPTYVRIALRCLSADGGWSVGDELNAPCSYYNGDGIQWAATSTTIKWITGATSVRVLNASTGAEFQISTFTNWGVVVYAAL